MGLFGGELLTFHPRERKYLENLSRNRYWNTIPGSGGLGTVWSELGDPGVALLRCRAGGSSVVLGSLRSAVLSLPCRELVLSPPELIGSPQCANPP